ncbi:MAG: glycosyltransferase family 4 protein [Bacteroidales bacterium]|nr:glycosyltransferase family 4 protein [Bacteroidales bacterium]
MEKETLRLTVLFESDAFDRKGLFNAVHGRIRALQASGGCTVEAWCIQCRDSFLSRRIRHTVRAPRTDSVTIDGICYHLLWYRFSILDWLAVEKLHCRPFFFGRFLKRAAPRLSVGDLIAAHSLSGGLLARELSKRSGVPYYITWHGSDIHTRPGRNPLIRKETEALTAAATGNFYVSRALMEASAPFPGRKYLLRNGVDERFRPHSEEERKKLRARYELPAECKVVAYAGHFFPVKNTRTLPAIWREVRNRYDDALVFWLIGDGKEAPDVRRALDAAPALPWVDLGNRTPEEMPLLLQCVDVLVLPSHNEGLPLVAMEALSCGCHVVAARVGGLPEILEERDTVAHGPGFAERMATRVAECLSEPGRLAPTQDFSWAETARTELEIYRKCLNCREE